MRFVSAFVAMESFRQARGRTQLSLFNTLGALATALLLVTGFSSPAFADIVEGTGCIIDQPAYTHTTVNCTAGDLGLSSPVVTVSKACDFPGDYATLSILVDITTT